MVNHNYEHENDAHEPGGSWAGLLAGLLIGLLIGGLTGAVTMLLLAPQSGKRTRAKIHRQGAELARAGGRNRGRRGGVGPRQSPPDHARREQGRLRRRSPRLTHCGQPGEHRSPHSDLSPSLSFKTTVTRQEHYHAYSARHCHSSIPGFRAAAGAGSLRQLGDQRQGPTLLHDPYRTLGEGVSQVESALVPDLHFRRGCDNISINS